ncbi:MAG: threo-3-hydroxy-L-aspartate ammonia-lyase [Acidobacteria bacterium]|nr:threo-3-hydroxy-L-aspartate ammonia-lyase [Acidobacteriota bacterium]
MSASLPVEYQDVVRAAIRLDGVAHRTPVLTSRTLDDQVAARVFFKCENLQRMGAFKFRGAYNALSQLAARGSASGAIAYSSGNHAQAVALAGRLTGLSATIVMPENAPAVKLAATRDYGAEVITYDPEVIVREELAAQLAAERDLHLIPPFDHPHIIAGQGTAVRELLQEAGPLDLLLVPCGGGGLLSGSVLSARALSPGCRVVGVEPELGDDATRSFRTGKLCTVKNPATIADGARTSALGELTFPMVTQLVDDMVTVTDDALVAAMRWTMERMKIVVEPTAVLGLAALMERAVNAEGMRVGIVLSGGNVDLKQFAAWFGK